MYFLAETAPVSSTSTTETTTSSIYTTEATSSTFKEPNLTEAASSNSTASSENEFSLKYIILPAAGVPFLILLAVVILFLSQRMVNRLDIRFLVLLRVLVFSFFSFNVRSC